MSDLEYPMTAERWRDWRGQEYGQGDRVIYPVQQGSSSAHVREGVILDLFHVRRDKDWRWARITEEELYGGSDWDEIEYRIVVRVTGGSRSGLEPGKVVTLRKRDHVTLIHRKAREGSG